MENATKALIIVGAVLITILLISLSMYIINSVTESMSYSRNSLSELEIQTFNSQFTLFKGTRKSSTQVNQLIKAVASSNAIYDNKVAVKLYGLSGPESVLDSCRYVIYDNEDRLIRCNSGNIVSLDTISSYVDTHRGYNYTVTLHYCNPKGNTIGNNKDLNPIAGCILLIDIGKN